MAAAVVLAFGFCSSVYAQTAPSWRSASERPERIEAPPEVETPDISFEIDREALFGRPMGFAPEPETTETEPPTPELSLSTEPKLEPVPLAPETPLLEVPIAEPLAPEAQSELAESPATEPEIETLVTFGNADELPAPDLLSTPEPQSVATATAEDPVSEDEQAAMVRETLVDPTTSMVSIDRPAPVSSIAAPVAPAASFKLVRTRTVQPEYPREAARLQQEGWVDLRLTVGPNGRVSDVDVLDAKPRQLFDAAARRAARQWRFEPPAKSGVVEPQTAMIRLTFVMD
ncbi:MAG: TonB family protein [Pseudomonadota bacterium]